jgi:hypothetical protein
VTLAECSFVDRQSPLIAGEFVTGDIREKLLASEAVHSLKMEAATAAAFQMGDWETKQSVYYTDPITSKIRELDVLVQKHMHRRKRYNIGDPVISFSLVCKCKSLGGYHIVVTEDTSNKDEYSDIVSKYWLGSRSDLLLKRLVALLSEIKTSSIPKLRDYFIARAYPDEMMIWGRSNLTRPPVDIISSSFRETNSSNTREDASSVVWKSIMSLSSAREAIFLQASDLSDIVPDYYEHRVATKELARSIAYFYDEGVCRLTFVHPILVVQARLWRVDGAGLREISSARIEITNVNHEASYVDIVSETAMPQYARACLSHFDSYGRTSLRQLERRVGNFGWEHAQNAAELHRILNGSRQAKKPPNKPSVEK